jgi:hypothetical protein
MAQRTVIEISGPYDLREVALMGFSTSRRDLLRRHDAADGVLPDGG